MGKIAILLFGLLSYSVYAETINITCVRTVNDRQYSSNLTIISSSQQNKGKVYLDDKDLDQTSSDMRQVVSKVKITPSEIVFDMHADTYPQELGGKKYEAGSIDSTTKINRTSGLSQITTTNKGGVFGALVGEGTKYSEERCEPRKASKF